MDGACWVCICCLHSPVWDTNVRIFRVRGIECMCAQTRPRLILSPERVIGECSQTNVKSKGKIPSAEARRRIDPRRCTTRTASPTHYRLSYSVPLPLSPVSLPKSAVYPFLLSFELPSLALPSSPHPPLPTSLSTPHPPPTPTPYSPGAGIMEADDRQMTTVFTVQSSFHHRHSTNRVSWRVTIVGERAVTPHLVARRRW